MVKPSLCQNLSEAPSQMKRFPDFHVGTLHVYSETIMRPKSFGSRLPNETLPASQISMLEPYMSIVKPSLSQNLSEAPSQMKRFPDFHVGTLHVDSETIIKPKSFGSPLSNETLPASQMSMLEPYMSIVKPSLSQNLSEAPSQMKRFPDFHVGTLHVDSETIIKPKSFGSPLSNETLPASQISMLEPYMSIVKPSLSQNLSEAPSQMKRFPDFHVGTLHVYSETIMRPKSFGSRLPNETLPASQISMLEPYMSIVKPSLSQNLSEAPSQMKRFPDFHVGTLHVYSETIIKPKSFGSPLPNETLPRFPCWNLTCL